ncbi:MAG: hypothetical protein K9L98_00085 [Candidatus Pacebacteria bacterium]|nr:hypothetical protein [Candidatus Paceibacterota bacterium]MCF7862402.1 hypothetical protein [Candidatus Paceibacterota bacterium]
MQNRNIILFTIGLAILASIVLGYMYFSGSFKSPESTPTNNNFISNLWPFSKDSGSDGEGTNTTDISGYQPTPKTEDVKSKLTKISNMPIAGYGVFAKERYGEEEIEMATQIRYAERINGNIYQTFSDKIDERKFSSTTIPSLYESYFGNNGDSVMMRYLSSDGKTIQTYLGTLQSELLGADIDTENNITGAYLPEDVSEVALSPDKTKMFYLAPVGDGVVGVIAKMSGEGKEQVFDSPFTEWLVGWPNDRMITLTTKPSYLVQGFMYYLDPLNKEFGKIISGINGLTTLSSPGGRLILYADNNLNLKIIDRISKEVKSTTVQTLPEKCVWNKMSDYIYCAVPTVSYGSNQPDSWYQGEISFNDSIWKIESATGLAYLVSDILTEFGESMDATFLQLDEAEQSIFFINKKDSILWKLDLE